MEYTENMHKVGDWVHTENGIGIITNVFPEYKQYWEEISETQEKKESLFKDDPEMANKIFGETPKAGEWIKDVITVKRLCNHDLEPLTRTMCFSTLAYANDKITQKEMREVTKILKDSKIKKRFEKYECKYEQIRHLWKVYIPPSKAVEIKQALDSLDKNNSANLRIPMSEVESYLKNTFKVDIFQARRKNIYNNATIHTLSLPENYNNYYTSDKEQIFCKILISKQWYDKEELEEDIKKRKLNSDYFDNKVWEKHGWDGEEIEY